MIKNFIFDYGDVLYKFDRNTIVDRYCPDGDDRELFREAIFHRWKALDDGYATQEEYVGEALAMLPERLHGSALEALGKWPEAGVPITGNHKLIKKLKSLGYGIHLLSNAPAMLRDSLRDFEISGYFDSMTISGCIRKSKPDREIYEHLLRENSLLASECFFIDDLEQNVEGARACGITAYRFDGDSEKLADYIFGSVVSSDKQ